MYRILVGNDSGKVYLAMMTLIWPHMMVPHAMAATAAAAVNVHFAVESRFGI